MSSFRHTQATLLWHGDDARLYVRREAGKTVKKLGEAMFTKLMERLSVPSPPESEAGDYPGMQTGHLKGSFHKKFDRDKPEFIIYSTDPTSKFLELGTKNMAPRPWLRLIVSEFAKQALDVTRSLFARVKTNRMKYVRTFTAKAGQRISRWKRSTD